MEFFKYAIVDIGANSVRMIIYDIDTEKLDVSPLSIMTYKYFDTAKILFYTVNEKHLQSPRFADAFY